jgi:hypothetical protein
MKLILGEAGISRQAYHQHQRSTEEERMVEDWVMDVIFEKRKNHPVIGLRKIYFELKSPIIGRDKFFEIGKKLRLTIRQPKSYTRTTFSTKSNRYQNLLVDKTFQDINQIWVSDITYIRIGSNFAYLSMIMDVYSRRIIGFAVSLSLQATLCVEALKMALKNRKIKDYERQLIHHSDKGTQYIFHGYTELLEQHNIQISMCNSAYENAHMERLNGIIKNEYIVPMHINTFEQLVKWIPKIIQRYNEQRPHTELKMCNPIQFETILKDLPKCQRTLLNIFVEEKTKIFQKNFSRQLHLF